MEGIGADTVLGGRYSLGERLAHRGDELEYWSALDTTLGRDVAVTCLPSSGPYADAALDSARRAAGVDDARLVRILDVGIQDGVAWIIEEALSESESLASLMAAGPLPPEEVRRLVGEAAYALDSARHRGLHHLRLTPHAVLRTREGGVKITGVAVAAAIDAVDDLPPAEASREDTRTLVALIYGGLTGHWPLEETDGLSPARRLADGSLPAPSELVAGVPGDLDALCRLSLRRLEQQDEEQVGSGGDGPRTPGELARQIAPWSAEMIRGTGRGFGASQSAAGSTGQSPTASELSEPSDPASQDAALGAGTAAAGAGAAAAAALAHSGAHGHAGDRYGEPDGDQYGEQYADPYGDPYGDQYQGGGGYYRTSDEGYDARYDYDDDRGMPLLPGVSANEPNKNQTRVALTAVAGIVVLAVALAYIGISNLGTGGEQTPADRPLPTQAQTTGDEQGTAEPTETGTDESTETGEGTETEETEGAGEPLEIASITSYDPQGDGDERNDVIGRINDGDPSSSWNSHTYLAPEWGGLKDGVGVLVTLADSSTVTETELVFPEGNYGITVYVNDQPSQDGATELGSDDAASGTVTITGEESVEGVYVLVWFSEPWQNEEGWIAQLSAVTVR